MAIGIALALLLAVASTPGAAPHAAAETVVPGPAKVVTLRYGEIVVFRMAPAAGAAQMDLVLLRSGPAARDGRLAIGEMRAKLDRLDGTQTLLTVENGSPFYVSYQAVVTGANGGTTPTAVCTLLPGAQPSFEHWNQPVAALTLFGFRTVDEGSADCG